MSDTSTRATIRARYGAIATSADSCCGPECGCNDAGDVTEAIGYTDEELTHVPEGADLGLGSGNPVKFAGLQPGETVLDLGSGGGIDCFIAAQKVGPTGKVIGVDMTPEMIERSRKTLSDTTLENVEFRLGEIEALPVADGSVDVVLSNCVINLSPDRPRVLREAFRVLKPGGRLVVSDMVSGKAAPDKLAENAELVCACLPVPRADYLEDLAQAGFLDGTIGEERAYPAEALSTTDAVRGVLEDQPELRVLLDGFIGSVRGAIITARKPE